MEDSLMRLGIATACCSWFRILWLALWLDVGGAKDKQTECRQFFEKEAIDHGAAYYHCNPQTGKTEFVWRERDESSSD